MNNGTQASLGLGSSSNWLGGIKALTFMLLSSLAMRDTARPLQSRSSCLRTSADAGRDPDALQRIPDSREALENPALRRTKTNFRAISATYGTNSDKWVGKMMEVHLLKKQNPKTGLLVDSIALSLPNHDTEGNVEIE